MSEFVSVENFGKDHWSLLAYVHHCCVESKGDLGVLVRSKMRCNEANHPLLAHSSFAWKDTWGTRLKNFNYKEQLDVEKNEKEGTYKPFHDDWDCLNDLENAGFVEVINLSHGAVKLTENGMKVANQLNDHKVKGGMFANFDMPTTPKIKV